jgi:hypothetical protein
MTHRWTVQDAKAHLSEILSRARKGQPQRIGLEESCIVISEAEWLASKGTHFGKWLVENAPRGTPIELPPRDLDRGDPFAAKPKRAGARRHKVRK